MPKLNHVALTVENRDMSAKFYGKHFGFSRRVHDDDHLLILADESGGLLALSNGKPEVANLRTTHFGVQMDTPEEVRALRRQLADDGVVEAEWQERFPVRVQVFDPDGYRVEAYAMDM